MASILELSGDKGINSYRERRRTCACLKQEKGASAWAKKKPKMITENVIRCHSCLMSEYIDSIFYSTISVSLLIVLFLSNDRIIVPYLDSFENSNKTAKLIKYTTLVYCRINNQSKSIAFFVAKRTPAVWPNNHHLWPQSLGRFWIIFARMHHKWKLFNFNAGG